ncbi:hypothetical protein T484DRAFT_1776880, partial [Baffinella frigidus]
MGKLSGAFCALLFAAGFQASGNPGNVGWLGAAAQDAGAGRVAGCGRARIIGNWDQSLISYDAVSRTFWLEYDVVFDGRGGEEAARCAEAVVSRVELDDEIVATGEGGEVGVQIGAVGLGRHWMKIRAGEGDDSGEQALEFTLPFHPFIVITSPPNRAALPYSAPPWHVCFHLVPGADCSDSGSDPDRAAPWRVCFHLVPGADCSDSGSDPDRVGSGSEGIGGGPGVFSSSSLLDDGPSSFSEDDGTASGFLSQDGSASGLESEGGGSGECAPRGPAAVSVDGVRCATVESVGASGAPTCVDVATGFETPWAPGRHTITVELTDAHGVASGIMS